MSIEKDELDRVIKTAQDISGMQRDIHHIQNAMVQQNIIIQSQTDQINRQTEVLNKVNATLSEATGGWKTLMGAGTIGAALSVALLKIYAFFGGVR